MNSRLAKNIFYLVLVILFLVTALLIFLHGNGLLYQVLFNLKDAMDRGEQLRETILSYGLWAPVLFIFIQALQVVLAPIPGEASGLLGGYLFGVWPGFIYSTMGLTLGSWLAFVLSRLLGTLIIKKIQATKTYRQFNHLVYKGGFIIPFILFIVPGFPKDSLSWLLGLSRMPLGVFIFIAAAGRIPGTFMLSIQGAQVQQGNYLKFSILLLVTAIACLPFYLFRKQVMHRLSVYQRLINSTDKHITRDRQDD